MGSIIINILLVLGSILLIIILIFVLIFVLTFIFSSGVKKKANQILFDFENGLIEKVYNESIFPKGIKFEEFKNFLSVGSIKDITKAKKISWIGRGYYNGIKYIYGNFKLQNGEESLLTLEFMKMNGKLKLFSLYNGKPSRAVSDNECGHCGWKM